MKRQKIIVFSCVILLFCFQAFSNVLAQKKITEIIRDNQASVFSIITYDANNSILMQGSGFLISDNGNVITNFHVLEKATSAQVKTMDGDLYPVTHVIAHDEEKDLVLLSINKLPRTFKPLKLSNSSPEVGEDIVVIGSPLGLDQTVSNGIISGIRLTQDYGKIIQISAPISSGSSGSPILNMNGEVVGIATFQIVEGQNLNFAIPRENIEILSKNIRQKRTFSDWVKERAEERITKATDLFNKGKASYQRISDMGNAIPYYRQAIELNPDFVEAYYEIGQTYRLFIVGSQEKAIEPFEKVILLNPKKFGAYAGLFDSYYGLGRYSDIVRVFKQAIKVFINDFKKLYLSYYYLGVAYEGLNQDREAIDAYNKAINLSLLYFGNSKEVDDVHVADIYTELGSVSNKLKNYSEAVNYHKHAIRLKPATALYHYNLGIAYVNMNDKKLALQEYNILKNMNMESLDSAHSVWMAPMLFDLINKFDKSQNIFDC